MAGRTPIRDPLLQPVHETSVELGDLNQTQAREVKLTAKTQVDAEFLRTALSSVPILEGTNLHQILRFVQAMEPFRLQPREVAVRTGVPNDYLFVVHTGRVQVSGLGRPTTLGPGDFFGQEALDTGGPADFTAMGSGAADLFRLHRKVYKLLQMEFGTRLRMGIQSVIELNRAKRAPSKFQSIVTAALDRRRELKELNTSLEWLEFADVQAAVTQTNHIADLGKGQFGAVRLVLHAPTRKAYALKVQQSEGNSGSMPLRTMIDREIDAMREGASPFLMRFYGEYENKSERPAKSYMLLEALGGGSLEALMTQQREEGHGALSSAAVQFYFACTCAAIDALHSAAWMHRDLSAKNVMIGNNGYAKVIDVGLAKRVSEKEHTYTSCGTPLYLAPELIHKTGYGHKAEVWALGVLLHQLCSGRFPFMPPRDSGTKGNARKMELYQAICKDAPAMKDPCFTENGPLGEASKELVNRMLDKRPAERITIPQVFTSPFYQDFDFVALHAQSLPPPFVPKRHPLLPDPR